MPQSPMRRNSAANKFLLLPECFHQNKALMKDWPLYEVFIRSRSGLNHKHVGSLHAADPQMAIEHARDVYTRRLYDGRGKRLQRAIVEQYGKDRLIRSKVDAYVRLFERLLDMMNGSNRGEALVEACLASESGRIYVMLAEAAGRIPPQ